MALGSSTPRSPPLRMGGRYPRVRSDRKSTRLNSSHSQISYAVFCLKKKKETHLCMTHFAYCVSDVLPPQLPPDRRGEPEIDVVSPHIRTQRTLRTILTAHRVSVCRS